MLLVLLSHQIELIVGFIYFNNEARQVLVIQIMRIKKSQAAKHASEIMLLL